MASPKTKKRNILIAGGVVIVALLVYNWILSQRKAEDDDRVALALRYWDIATKGYMAYFNEAVTRFVAFVPVTYSSTKPGDWDWSPSDIQQIYDDGLIPPPSTQNNTVTESDTPNFSSAMYFYELASNTNNQNAIEVIEDNTTTFMACANVIFDLYIWPEVEAQLAAAGASQATLDNEYATRKYVNNWVMHIASWDATNVNDPQERNLSMQELNSTQEGQDLLWANAVWTVRKGLEGVQAGDDNAANAGWAMKEARKQLGLPDTVAPNFKPLYDETIGPA